MKSSRQLLHIVQYYHPDLEMLINGINLLESDLELQDHAHIYEQVGIPRHFPVEGKQDKMLDFVDNVDIVQLEEQIHRLLKDEYLSRNTSMIYSHYLDGFFLKSWEKVYRLLGLEPHILILYTPPEWAVEQCINHDIEWIKSNTRLFWQPRALRKYQRSMSAKQQQFLNSWQKYMDVLREWCDETTNSHIISDITQLRSQSELVERLSDIGLSPSAEGAEWTIPDRKQVSKYADTSIQALHTYFMHSSK